MKKYLFTFLFIVSITSCTVTTTPMYTDYTLTPPVTPYYYYRNYYYRPYYVPPPQIHYHPRPNYYYRPNRPYRPRK